MLTFSVNQKWPACRPAAPQITFRSVVSLRFSQTACPKTRLRSCCPPIRICRAEQMPPKYKGSVESSPATQQRVAVLGGGQLGKMLGAAAARMGVKLKVLDPTENCPAASVAEQVLGDFSDFETVRSFVTDEDVLTVEIEHVDAKAMQAVREASGVDVEPTPETLALIQDKYRQKQHFNKNGVNVTSAIEVSGEGQADLAVMVLGFPFMLKAKRLAYDGRGNAVVKSFADLDNALHALGGYKQDLYGEKWVKFTKEVAVMVARAKNGTVSSYPVTETIHRDSICYVTQTPAQIPAELHQAAQELAEKAVSCLEGAGVFGVEMFVAEGGELMLNEVAPRPHNSGHYTIEACAVSQFEQHLRAVLGLPLGDASLKVGNSIMLNILGEADGEAGSKAAQELLNKAYSTPGASVHWYGKKGVSKNRKVGHITITAATAEEAQSRLAQIEPAAADALKRSADAFEEDWAKVQAAKAKEADGVDKEQPGGGLPVLAMSVSALEDNSNRSEGAQHQELVSGTCGTGSTQTVVSAAAVERGPQPVSDQPEASTSGSGAEVAVIMGSDSDLATMRAAAEILREFGICCEVTVVSAHRTPDRMLDYARAAHARGVKVIIAGAGGAAHLPGMVAALTPLPVIGVPVTPKGAHLDGLDALMSIVQMPRGVPVATVAIGNAANAGLLAARILATSNPALLQRVLSYQEKMRTTVMAKAERLESVGWEQY